MNVKAFIVRLKELSSCYREWWYPQFNRFRTEYSKDFPNSDYNHYTKAYNEFKANLRSQNDVLGEIFDFIDKNCEVYLNASLPECEEIRKTVSDCRYADEKSNMNHFLEELFFQYAKDRAIPQLEKTGDKIWLTRGLIAISLENSGIDFRDSIFALSKLREVALEKNIGPEPEFVRIAQISSSETPRGGSMPMRLLMENVGKPAT